VSSLQRWFHEFGRPPRILGLDVARGLAILGMAGAHIGDTPTFEWTDPATWTDLVHGRSSILFAVLAGVSIALMTGREAGPDPARLPSLRLNLVGRGGVIFVIGILLEYLNTPIAVILTLYGLIYVVAIPVLRWQPWQLLLGAGVLALLGPATLAALNAVTLNPYGAGLTFVISGSYPITVWMAFVLGGMALGRLRVASLRTALVALGIGTGLAVVGYTVGALGQGIVQRLGADGSFVSSEPGWEGYPEALAAADPLGAALRAFLAVDAHTGGTAEILGSGGFAVAVIAVCLLISGPLRGAVLPLGALGSMPLSAYTGHILVIALISGPGAFFTDGVFWLVLSIGLVIVATLWSAFVGQGPLERLVARAARAMSGPGVRTPS
jgi:uncharacterized membrane protein YeiB